MWIRKGRTPSKWYVAFARWRGRRGETMTMEEGHHEFDPHVGLSPVRAIKLDTSVINHPTDILIKDLQERYGCYIENWNPWIKAWKAYLDQTKGLWLNTQPSSPPLDSWNQTSRYQDFLQMEPSAAFGKLTNYVKKNKILISTLKKMLLTLANTLSKPRCDAIIL